MLTLYDAARCPYCARVRIVLAEKDIPCDVVAIDLDNRPAFIVELNPPSGRVPVIEEDAFVLPESNVIMEYLEERYPASPLLPSDAAERGAHRLAIERFDDFGDAYYDLYNKRPTGSAERLDAALGQLEARLERHAFLAGASYGLADIAYVPWILRVESRVGHSLDPFEAIRAWRDRLLERPAIAAEADVVASL